MTREQSIVLLNNLPFVAGDDVDFKGMAVENNLKKLRKSPCPRTQAVIKYFQFENVKFKISRSIAGSSHAQAPFLFLEDTFDDDELYVEVSREFAKEMCDLLPDPFIQLRILKDNQQLLGGIHPANSDLFVMGKRFKLRDVLTDDSNWRDVQLTNRAKSFSFPNVLDQQEQRLLCRLSLGWEDPGVKMVKICAPSFLRKLLGDTSTMDLTLVAGNGAEIKCHKLIFTSHAPTFSAMLSSRSGMKESRSGRVNMKENSEDGLRQLVRYLYGLGMDIGDMPSDLALELFQTAHKYGLSELEITLFDLFLERGVEWFTPAGILELYLYVRNLTVFRKLREHSLRLLSRMPTQELRACEEFRKLSKAETTDLLSKLVDYLQKSPASDSGSNGSDVRGTKRRRESSTSNTETRWQFFRDRGRQTDN